MKETRTFGYIDENGVLFLHRKTQFLESVGIMGKGKYTKIENICRKIYDQRDVEHNAYYWGYIVEEWRRLYYEQNAETIDKRIVDNTFKNLFCYKELVNEGTGEITKLILEHKDYTTPEFSEYCEKCARYTAEWFGIKDLLKRNEQSKMFDEDGNDAPNNNN